MDRDLFSFFFSIYIIKMNRRNDEIIIKTKRKKKAPQQGPFICYALTDVKTQSKSYTGKTNNFERRLRQHNGELKGGARYTHRTASRWMPLFHVLGFETLRAVLQFEMAMKRKKRSRRGPRGRVQALEHLLSLGRLTQEKHSHFANNGIHIKCFMSMTRYLKLADLTQTQFDLLRMKQGVSFRFVN